MYWTLLVDRKEDSLIKVKSSREGSYPYLLLQVYTPMFTATLFTIAKAWKQPKDQSTDKWIKMQYMYRMEYYSATK